MSWSDAQLRILRALGHEPFMRATDRGRVEVQQPRQDVAPAGPASFDVLAAAIARAAGGRDLTALALDLESLRREPARKRALWPQLRRLRRGH